MPSILNITPLYLGGPFFCRHSVHLIPHQWYKCTLTIIFSHHSVTVVIFFCLRHDPSKHVDVKSNIKYIQHNSSVNALRRFISSKNTKSLHCTMACSTLKNCWQICVCFFISKHLQNHLQSGHLFPQQTYNKYINRNRHSVHWLACFNYYCVKI